MCTSVRDSAVNSKNWVFVSAMLASNESRRTVLVVSEDGVRVSRHHPDEINFLSTKSSEEVEAYVSWLKNVPAHSSPVPDMESDSTGSSFGFAAKRLR